MILFLAVAAASALAQPPIIVDNDQVKVLKVSNTAGQKSRMHKHHVNRVMIHLDAGTMRLTSDKGVVQDVKFTPGQVRWDPAGGLHTSENVGGTPYRIVEVELKKPHGAAVKFPALDPPTIDPKHYKVEFENDQVRVVRAKMVAGDKIPLHEHALPRVLVHLTDMNVGQTLPDGKKMTATAKAGDVVMAGAAKHAEVNLGGVFEIVVVELK